MIRARITCRFVIVGWQEAQSRFELRYHTIKSLAGNRSVFGILLLLLLVFNADWEEARCLKLLRMVYSKLPPGKEPSRCHRQQTTNRQ